MTFPLIDTLAAIAFTIFLPPFFLIVVLVVFLASVGKTVGIRLRYIEILLYIFEFGKKRLAKKRRYLKSTSTDVSEEEEEDSDETEGQNIFRKISTVNAYHRKTHEFQLSDSFEYIARGMEAIVDDEVTKRFTAEELTSWNFLTRTNLDYEFISVRLTVFWVGGFIVRYLFLLPLRLCILSIGMGLLVAFTTAINLIPDHRVRKNLGYWAYLATFRLVSRAISAVIRFHNLENRPKSDGICVANHTSPIDCAILSCDNVYAFMGLLVLCTYVVGYLPAGPFKKQMNRRVSMFCFEFLSGALSLFCRYHNKENIPRQGICVANHTSPMDVVVLACDNAYDLVGQIHGGFLGIFQRALSRASDHIWFERGEVKDRFAVARRLKAHVEDPTKMPILIFPEGTCINNTSVMQFKKGTFEVGSIIYPVAIKYDPRFGDAFWNSSKYSMVNYLYMMMTSWAIVCDVWYLPPMTKRETESSIEFANRVKAEIAKQGGLVDLLWDGALKRSAPKKEFKEYFQREYSSSLRLVSQDSDADETRSTSESGDENIDTPEEREKMLFNNICKESKGVRHNNNTNGVSIHNGSSNGINGISQDEVPRNHVNEEIKKRKYGFVNPDITNLNDMTQLNNFTNNFHHTTDIEYLNDKNNHITTNTNSDKIFMLNHMTEEPVREKAE